MRFAAQIRAARALLGWSQTQLAAAADVGFLEQAGIQFTDDEGDGIGVRLQIGKVGKSSE
jgi:hypothetical protein